MRSMKIRVLVADDHPIVREGLEAILGNNPSVDVVGVATTFAQVIDILKTIPVDMIILDLGGMDGAPLILIQHLSRVYPLVKVIVFSSSVDLAPELLQAGVQGYVVKEELSSQLISAIKVVHGGQRFLSPIVDEYLEQTIALGGRQQLAPKELSVLKLLSDGLGTIEIAEQLAIDPRSVQNYITVLRRKIGCHERTQLVGWYRRMYLGE
jgi:DNA-binding NarL/FixJ family response regulator